MQKFKLPLNFHLIIHGLPNILFLDHSCRYPYYNLLCGLLSILFQYHFFFEYRRVDSRFHLIKLSLFKFKTKLGDLVCTSFILIYYALRNNFGNSTAYFDLFKQRKFYLRCINIVFYLNVCSSRKRKFPCVDHTNELHVYVLLP